MQRRQFLRTATALATLPNRLLAGPPKKVPFHVLYSNDTTNITGCISPWHKAGEPFSARLLEASVDEVADKVDAHFLQPGLGMVPMWPSKVLPLKEHYAWIKQHYGQSPDAFGNFVMNGGDVVKVFIDRCHKTHQAAFISLRLNDAHHKEFAFPKPGSQPGSNLGMSVTRHYVEHPEFILNQGSTRSADVVQNWMFPEVSQQKLALITELCENYDLDGVELDFMRFNSFFNEAKSSRSQRCSIITSFVRQVRSVMDKTTREGRHRWLCVRVPCLIKGLDALGIDLTEMVNAGVDMVTASASYFTTQQMDLVEICRRCEGAALYVELCHSIENGPKLTKGYDTFDFRRTTQEQMQTTAHLAYARGADGVSLFNFAYYRPHGGPGRGEFSEPPFNILKTLGDAAVLAQGPQHWFIAPGWNNAYIRPPLLPRKLDSGKKTAFRMDLAPPSRGWKHSGTLRLQCDEDLAEMKVTAHLNESKLEPSQKLSEPFPNPSPSLLGRPEQMLAWTVPVEVLRDGQNLVEFTLQKGSSTTLHYIDLRLD